MIDKSELAEMKSKLKELEAEAEAVKWLLTTKKIISCDELSEETKKAEEKERYR